MKTWFSRPGNQRPALRNRGDEDGLVAHRDRFAARFRVAGGILHRRFHQTRARLPGVSGRPAKYSGSCRSKRQAPSLSVVPLTAPAWKAFTSMPDALTVTWPWSTDLPKK